MGSYCKIDESGNFFILGDSQGNFFNPVDPSKPLTFIDSQKGKNYWNFLRVTKSVFDKYNMFLQTRGGNHLRAAEREYRNG